MNQVVVLECTFSPIDYFEQTVEVRRDDYILKIENGKAAAVSYTHLTLPTKA